MVVIYGSPEEPEFAFLHSTFIHDMSPRRKKTYEALTENLYTLEWHESHGK